MRPKIIGLILSSVDGGLHPSRFTSSPDGDQKSWGVVYEKVHSKLNSDGWIVGRVTMAEMTKATAHPPTDHGGVERPVHIATKAAGYAVALDPSGKLHFEGGSIGDDHVVVLLGHDVADSHLAELAADGVSYIVSEAEAIDLVTMVEVLGSRFGIKRLLLEGGASINGAFLAAGLVEEFHVVVAPAFDGNANVETIVATDGGLRGKIALRFVSAAPLEHGAIHLSYAVMSA